MRTMTRRDFLRFAGTGLGGLAISGIGFPVFMPRRALASTAAWKFGVMADTQWRTGANAGGEPASCAVSIVNALNEQFIQHDVKFVIQVGDLVDVESVNGIRSLPTRADAASALYNHGIGFFPVRGNHESSAVAAIEIPDLFPQTLGQGGHLFGATNFDSPILASTATDPEGDRLKGLSYAFDYENVRCILIDQFVRADGSNVPSTEGSYNANATDQVGWVDSVLAAKPSDSHAIVFSHKNLIGQNHKDVLFGKLLTSNPGPRDEFLASLHSHGVRYYMSGHDHMHHRSIVQTADSGLYPGHSVGQLICSSNSYKFYIPKIGDDGREIPFDQELFTIGYYIVTVDGPRLTVDFYSSSHGQDYGDFDLIYAPASFGFYWRETFGYSLNGKQFQVAHGDSYTVVEDAYEATVARILSGTNGNTETDQLGRSLVKTVNTGWSHPLIADAAASNILTLWGLADNLSLYDGDLTGLLPEAAESKKCDTFALSLSYDPKRVRPSQLINGRFGLASRDATGAWVKAVDMNFGGTKTFKYGPWRAAYGLGTYGVDPSTRTVWAVLNHDGDFVAKLH